MKRTGRYFVALLAASCLAAVSVTAPVAAIESFGVGARPANPDPQNPRTQSIFVYDTAPGKTIKDAVVVSNNNPEPKTVVVYATDSQIASDGAFACEQAADKADDAGSWIELSKQEVQLEPAKQQQVPFVITIPANAGVGEHNACVVVQEKAEAKPSGQNGIALSFRSALRVAFTIPGDLRTDLRFQSMSSQQNDKQKIVITPELASKSNVSVDVDIEATLTDMFGRTVGRSKGKFPVLRDATSRYNFEVDRPFWGGWYTARAKATYKPLSKSFQQEPRSVESRPVRILVRPSPKALAAELAAIAAIAAGAATVFMRIKRKREFSRFAVAYQVEPGDDIQSIAASHQIAWKQLAKANRLKPPYSLKAGDTVHVPRRRRKLVRK